MNRKESSFSLAKAAAMMAYQRLQAASKGEKKKKPDECKKSDLI
jgi:hypothetical protein